MQAWSDLLGTPLAAGSEWIEAAARWVGQQDSQPIELVTSGDFLTIS